MSIRLLEKPHESMAASLAAAASVLAARINDGATLWCIAPGLEDHARHLAVEFVHPASVGARAVPAVALPTVSPHALVATVRSSARTGDVIISMGDAESTRSAELGASSRAWGVTHVHLGWRTEDRPLGSSTDYRLDASPTRFVSIGADATSERFLTRAYHLLWELTFICMRTPGWCPAPPGERQEVTSSFLYPSLKTGSQSGAPSQNGGMLDELAAAVRATWAEAVALDEESLAVNTTALEDAASLVGARAERGGRLLVMGNGGSACDADRLVRLVQDVAPARSLVDPAVLSAIANDVGAARMFARQVETFATPADVVIVFSTSGTSANILEAVAAAKQAGAATIAFAGYGGGALAEHDDVDVCLRVESSSVHRIQEAQGALCNALVVRIAEVRKGQP